MTAYIILLFLIVIFQLCSNNITNKDKSKNVFLLFAFITLYLFFVLRDFSVGRDIPGYIEVYELTKDIPFNNWDYVYMEKGYQFLMKICNILGLSSRLFFFIVNLIILAPLWLFLKKYSVNPFMSLFLYICFQFFAFSMTGLRQAMAMSLCLVAFIFAMKDGKKNFFYYLIFVALASSIHTSALIYIPTYFLMRIRVSIQSLIMYIVGVIVCYGISRTGIVYIMSSFEKNTSISELATLGLSLVLFIGFTIMSYFVAIKHKNSKDKEMSRFTSAGFNIMAASICTLILFNGSLLLRASMYYYIIQLAIIPLFFASLPPKGRHIGSTAFIVFMMYHFFFSGGELEPFDLIPYKFYF